MRWGLLILIAILLVGCGSDSQSTPAGSSQNAEQTTASTPELSDAEKAAERKARAVKNARAERLARAAKRRIRARRAKEARVRAARRERLKAKREREQQIAAKEQESNCDQSYPDVCLDPNASDYDCEGGSGDGPEYVDGPVTVTGSDPFDLDADGDGVGCQS